MAVYRYTSNIIRYWRTPVAVGPDRWFNGPRPV